jgi:hypothetical protein
MRDDPVRCQSRNLTILWTCEDGFFSLVGGGVIGAAGKLSGGVLTGLFDMIARYVLTLDIASKRQIKRRRRRKGRRWRRILTLLLLLLLLLLSLAQNYVRDYS